MLPPQASPPLSTREAAHNPWAVAAAVLVGLWAVTVTVLAQGVGWLVDQVLLQVDLPTPAWAWPLMAVVNALLVGVPAGLLAVLPRAPAVREAGRAWLLGALALGVLGLLRALPMAHHELYLGALALVAGTGAIVIRRMRPARRGSVAPVATLFGIAAGLALLLPWLWFGALGGLLETALAIAAAVAVGGLAGAILDRPFWSPYAMRPAGGAGRTRLVLLGGLVAGVALALLAAGVGASGAQLAALLALPPAAFSAAALNATGGAPMRWIAGLAVLGPLAFVDPEEISLLLLGRDVPFWAAMAALGSLGVALLFGIGYALAFVRARPPRPPRWFAVTAVVAISLTGIGGYVGAGQPGLYGERLFVVMRDQAPLDDLAMAAPGAAGRDARVRAVYTRLVEHARRTQAPLRRQLDRWHLRYTPYYLVNGIEVHAGPELRAWLSHRADVDRVLLSQRLRPVPSAPTPTRGDETAPSRPPWNITMLGAERVWAQLGATGAGIVVGSSDSGVDGGHPALAGGFRGGDDSWYDPWYGSRTPTDRDGHGTHTVGSAVGRDNVGVAPGARWVGCVNLGRNLGNPAHYLDCLQFMLAPFPTGADPFSDGRPERAPHVLINSWGCPTIEGCDAGVLRPATAAFAAAGVFFVAAAGNAGPLCGSIDDPPAPYPDVITVGAVDSDRRVAEFSGRGPGTGAVAKPDLTAPGVGVLSALPGGGYGELDGTSMATPHVAGVVALMWSANPKLIGDLDRTRLILRETARPVDTSHLSGADPGGCGRIENLSGAGIIDAYAAVRAAQEVG